MNASFLNVKMIPLTVFRIDWSMLALDRNICWCWLHHKVYLRVSISLGRCLMLISWFHSGYGFCLSRTNASCTCNNKETRADCQLDPPEEADLPVPVHVTFFLGVALMGLCIIVVYCYKKRNIKPTQYALFLLTKLMIMLSRIEPKERYGEIFLTAFFFLFRQD